MCDSNDNFVSMRVQCSESRKVMDLEVNANYTVRRVKKKCLALFTKDVTPYTRPSLLSDERQAADNGQSRVSAMDCSTTTETYSSSETLGSQYVNLLHIGRSLHDQICLNPDDFVLIDIVKMQHLNDDHTFVDNDLTKTADYLLMRRLVQLPLRRGTLSIQLRATPALSEGAAPSEREIRDATKFVTPVTKRHLHASAADASVMEARVLMRRIYLGVAHWSLRQMGDVNTTQLAFDAVLDKLHKRHQSSLKPESIQQLMDMGFNEQRSSLALKLKSTVDEAAAWLLQYQLTNVQPPTSEFRALTPADDPVEVLMPRFWDYRRTYFLPQMINYTQLIANDFVPSRVFDMLMQTDRDFTTSRMLLTRERETKEDLLYAPLADSHPIMEAIAASPALHANINKPKVLYALLALCETPTNYNLWLSDPDTCSIVRLIIKAHHEERFNRKCDFGRQQPVA